MNKVISMLATLLMAGTVQAAVCDGTFNMTSNGYAGFLNIVNNGGDMSRETFSGDISMGGGPTYLVNGICDNTTSGGRIQFNVTFPNGSYVTYSGTYFFGATATQMTGRFYDGRYYYNWSAYQTYNPGGPGGGGFVSDCAGDYDINSNGTTGLLHLELDTYGGLTGHVTLGSQPTQTITGVCQTQPNGRVYVSFTRYNGRITQEYKGYLNVSAAGVHMSGNFTQNGRTYRWHANRH